MSKIHVLDEHIANMIAAGEVVERPANIVKECIENSIDAKSTAISIEAYEGGIERLVITDDGIGMDSQDATMAFMRHATSKLKDEDDLFNIQTMGFRGEALPSIASVAKVELQTNNQEQGTLIRYEYGEKKCQEECSCPRGTKMDVSGLFFKTPARFKYLKRPAYEFSIIADLVNKMALSYPNVRFTLSHNGRVVFQTSGNGNIQEIMFQMYGREVAQSSVSFDEADDDFHITGQAVMPKINRATKNFIFISINHRLIRSIQIQKAIIDAYQDFMPPNRYPIFIIDIEVDAQLVDVNVHPNKWEVRVSKQRDLIQLIQNTIQKAFTEALKTVEVPPKRIVQSVNYEQPSFTLSYHKEPDTPVKQEYKTETKPYTPETVFQPKEEIHENTESETGTYKIMEPETVVQEEPETYETETPEEFVPEPENENHIGKEFFYHLRVIGQLRSSYILCENEEGLVIVDQHAAQERYHYEELQEKLMRPCQQVQPRMVPIQLNVSSDILTNLLAINEKTSYFGIVFEPFGMDQVIVREVPLWFESLDEEAFLYDLLDYFKQNNQIDMPLLRKHVIATTACHSSIRFNRDLTMQEMERVIEDLQKCKQPYHCPHGRPTVITLSDKDLRKEFERG